MRLFDNLRSSERKTVKAVLQGMTRAREEWGDLERAIRQRMRVYPQKLMQKKKVMAVRAEVQTTEVDLQPDNANVDLENRNPIVSIHGQDISDIDSEKDKTRALPDKKAS